MIKIGLEQGTNPNRYIYSYMADQDELTLEEQLDTTLTRLSITCDDEIELKQLAPMFLPLIANSPGMDWMILTGWSESSSFLTPARARLKEKRLCDVGFSFDSCDGYRLGLSLPFPELSSLFIEELLTRKSYGICAKTSLLESSLNCLTDLIRSSARSFAAPNSESVVKLLNETVRAIAYMNCDDSIRPGLVILADRSFGLRELVARFDSNAQVWEGETADQVWSR